GYQGALVAKLLVVRDREAMGLVPDPLEGLERGRRQVEDERVEAPRVVDLLRALRERDDGEVVEAELFQDASAGTQLTATAVEQDEVREGPAVLEGLAVPPAEHLGHHREIVGARHGPDLESLVVLLLHPAALPDDHGADGLLSLDVRDVETLDPVRSL